jgi:hypothetical protein
MEKIKTKKTAEIKPKPVKKDTTEQPVGALQTLTRGEVAKGGSSSSKTKPIT